MIRLCFVCLGNICRSPTAEAVMSKLVANAGLLGKIEIDSAGTGSWHEGQRADTRSRARGHERGYDLTSIARQIEPGDFEHFDYLLAMDQSNVQNLWKLAPNDEAQAKVHLLRSFDPTAEPGAEVPDPYYGGEDGFGEVLDICERACGGLLAHLRKTHGL